MRLADINLAACAALVERGDPDRFLAAMAAPVAQRGALFVLYAANLELARIPWATSEPLIAAMRLQWWRDLAEAAGSGRGDPPAHEVAGPLFALIREAGLPVAAFDRMAAARERDCERAPFADAGAFAAYLDDTAGGLMWLSVRALGGAGLPAGFEAVARDAGWAMGLAAWLRAVPELEARGRVPLVDGRAEAIASLAGEGLARWARARAVRAPRAVVPALRAGWQAPAILRQARAEPGRVAAGALGQSEFARRFGLLRRVALGGW